MTGRTPKENRTNSPVRISLTNSNESAEREDLSCLDNAGNVDPASVLTANAMPPIAVYVYETFTQRMYGRFWNWMLINLGIIAYSELIIYNRFLVKALPE